ncbi:M48 family metallopeptidase [Streptacidiphilus monticola]|uniref:M48 family metallopeptidase n=1 Tax=Streptacidiphilus monticola TaxID=2161674 RepID=A0ABW1G403_9ACTN
MKRFDEDFTEEQVARSRARRRDTLPLRYASAAVGLVVPCLLGFTPLGAAVIAAVGDLAGGGWAARAASGAVALQTVLSLVGLPLSVRGEIVNRRWGLSVRRWSLFATDALKGFALAALVSAGVATALYALLRSAPARWWLWAALAGAAGVFLLSFLVPVVLEPLFNRFRPLDEGPLREQLAALVAGSGVPVRQLLVSDASRRTTATNAYVSGIGRTRRLVLWDTTIQQAPHEEVAAIAAHELGHAARRDVLGLTALSALGVAAGTAVLAAALRSPALLSAAGVSRQQDPRSLGLVLAVVAVLGAVTGPAFNAVSRRVEARADGYALDLTQAPDAVVAMERRLAVANLTDLDPDRLTVWLFATHPPIRDRIAHARSWAAERP